MCAWRFGGAAVVAQQRWREHVLNEGGLARTADASDTHQALQGELDAQVLQVVLACALEDQAWRVVGHEAFEA